MWSQGSALGRRHAHAVSRSPTTEARWRDGARSRARSLPSLL
jgi:hypothetical protein